jgi:hypothetical protein
LDFNMSYTILLQVLLISTFFFLIR